MSSIGRMNETDLHEQLKHLYAEGAATEHVVDGFVVDVLRDGEIIEIQTRNLNVLRKKIERLAREHRVRIVHPVAATTLIVKSDESGVVTSRRRSPKRGNQMEAFREITRIANLLPSPRITVEIVMVDVVENRSDDGRGSWRRHGVSITGRQLERVSKVIQFTTAKDYLSVLPETLPREFTNTDLAEATGLRYRVVQPVTSALRKMGLVRITGKRGQSLLYAPTRIRPDALAAAEAPPRHSLQPDGQC